MLRLIKSLMHFGLIMALLISGSVYAMDVPMPSQPISHCDHTMAGADGMDGMAMPKAHDCCKHTLSNCDTTCGDSAHCMQLSHTSLTFNMNNATLLVNNTPPSVIQSDPYLGLVLDKERRPPRS